MIVNYNQKIILATLLLLNYSEKKYAIPVTWISRVERPPE